MLVASGLASQNYSFVYQAGDFTIVGADQLLVKLGDTEITYGDAVTYTIASAAYYSSTATQDC